MPEPFTAFVLGGAAILAVIVVLFIIEFRAVARGEATISEGAQRLAKAMDKQLIAGIAFAVGLVAGWFIAHFTSPPPT